MAAATYHSSSSSYVVWIWVNGQNISIPFSPDISYNIEREYQLKKPTYTLPVTGETVNLKEFTYTRTRRRYAIRRKPLYLPPSPDINGYWEWDSGHGVFLPYAVAASVDIELVYTRGFPSIDLAKSTSNIPYHIDLKRRVQRRHGYGTERNIRRISLLYSLQSYLIDQSKHSLLPTVSYASPAATVIASSKTSTRGSSSSMKSKKKSSSPMITANSSSSCAPTVHPSSLTGKPLGHRETPAYKSGAVSSCHVETRSKLRKIQVLG